MEKQMDLENKTTLKKFSFYFDKYTSKNETDWFLILVWVFSLELFSSILELKFIDMSQNYIIHLEEGVYKEIIIALFVVLFVWSIVYNIVYMRKDIFYYVLLYTSFCIYLFITHDLTFNLLIHNLNPAELFVDGIGFYMFTQLILKVMIIYLLYKLLRTIKKSKGKI